MSQPKDYDIGRIDGVPDDETSDRIAASSIRVADSIITICRERFKSPALGENRKLSTGEIQRADKSLAPT